MSEWGSLGTGGNWSPPPAATEATKFIPRIKVAPDIDTSETTTDTNFTDLATVGPTVEIDVGPLGILLVFINASLDNSGANVSRAAVALSGANTLAAAADNGMTNTGTDGERKGCCIPLTGLNPGRTTVTVQYNVSAGTGTFEDRKMFVVTL